MEGKLKGVVSKGHGASGATQGKLRGMVEETKGHGAKGRGGIHAIGTARKAVCPTNADGEAVPASGVFLSMLSISFSATPFALTTLLSPRPSPQSPPPPHPLE